jgi:hypothetical protein
MRDQGTASSRFALTLPNRLVVVILCAGFLLLDLFSLATIHAGSSTVGGKVADTLGWKERHSSYSPWISVVIAHTPDGPIVALGPQVPFVDSMDPPILHPSTSFTLWPPKSSAGFWAPTRESPARGMYNKFTGTFNIQILPPVELQEPIRAFIASTYDPWKLAKYDELIATGGVGTTPILTGYIHNVISLAVAITMLVRTGSLALHFMRFTYG